MARSLYEAVNGERSVAEILLHAHASEYLVTKFLFELHRIGAVEIAGVVPVPSPADDVSLEFDLHVPEPVAVGDVSPGVEPTRPESRAAAQPAGRPEAAPRPETDIEIARRLMAQGDFDAALEILDRAYRIQPPAEPRPRPVAGAEAAFRKGLEINPDMKGAHFFLGHLYLRQAEDPVEEQAAAERAATEYEAEVRLTPDNDSVAYNLGLARLKAGQDDQALAALERATTLNPAKGEAFLKMASMYEKRKDGVKAQEMYQKFSAADPANAAVSLYNIGVIGWNENRGRTPSSTTARRSRSIRNTPWRTGNWPRGSRAGWAPRR